jgi:hypothetical protein
MIVLQNYAASIDKNASRVMVPNLTPSTPYAVYCMSQGTSGSQLSLSKILATRRTVPTACCKRIYVQLNALSVYEKKDIINLMT